MEEVEEGETQRSTKRPLGKRKRESAVPSKAEAVMNEAVPILKATASQPSDPIDDEEIFGRNIACGLRKIKDERSKEFAKVKLQEIIWAFNKCTISARCPHTTAAATYLGRRFKVSLVAQFLCLQSHTTPLPIGFP